jgi:hypothetical protein
VGGVIRFAPKSERERARLIRTAGAIYNSIFPPADPVSEQQDKERFAIFLSTALDSVHPIEAGMVYLDGTTENPEAALWRLRNVGQRAQVG